MLSDCCVKCWVTVWSYCVKSDCCVICCVMCWVGVLFLPDPSSVSQKMFVVVPVLCILE